MLSIEAGLFFSVAGLDFRWLRDRGAWPALDHFCQHVDHGRPVFDDQGVGRFIGYDTAFRRQKRLQNGSQIFVKRWGRS